MKALRIEGGIVKLDYIEDDLRALQNAVGGYIETVGLIDDAVMIVDEEGRLKGKPYNQIASLIAQTGIVGTALIVGVDGDEFDDVPEQYLPLLKLGE